MEEELSGASFSDAETAPTSEYGKYLDTICPYFMMCGMTWSEFWFEDLDRLRFYANKHKLDIERRNQELWLQGIYIQEAVAAVFDSKHIAKYPEKPHRITPMTPEEQEAENKRKVEQFRAYFEEHKRRWDDAHKEVK